MNTVLDTDRLRRLLLMLSSPYDNEVVTAVKKITRVLEEGGSDWHDLASRLAVPPQPASKQMSEPRREWENLEAAEIAEALLKAAGNRLTNRERDFLENMISWTGHATPKQDSWLRAIAAKLEWAP